MKKKKIFLLTALVAILYVSCSNGGGGGGSSNSSIRVPDNKLNIPNAPNNSKNKNDQENKEAENGKNNETNSSNKKESSQKDDDIKSENNDISQNKNENSNGINGQNNYQEREKNKIDYEKLRNEIGEEEFKKFIFKERENSKVLIPTDTNESNKGGTQKVAIIDGDFISQEENIKKEYPETELIKKTYGTPYPNDHGRIVLESLKEDKNKLNLILGSIGYHKDTTVSPKLNIYEMVLEKFDPKQKVKVINQSWGVPVKIGDYKGLPEENKMMLLARNNVEEGRKLLNFYEKQVKNNVLFVWANGNKTTDRTLNDAYFQAGLPYIYSDLEKGWISVVGIQKSNDKGELNVHYQNHLAFAGNAKWWAISADSEIKRKDGNHIGSSFAAPRVARAAALVSEKFDWMTAEQVRHTLFTTTDRTEISKDEVNVRNTSPLPDEKYGWGMLNLERALKGPGAFINTLSQYQFSVDTNNVFDANIPEGKISYFENDIHGNGGLLKSGKGTLHLTGNNSYEKNSIVKDGTLEIHKIHSSGIDVEESGKLILHGKTIIGYQNEAFQALIDEKNISPDRIIAKNLINKGTVEIKGNTAIIGGDYIAKKGSKTEMDLSSKVRVLGKIDLDGSTINLESNKYISSGEKIVLMEANEVKDYNSETNINGMRNANLEVNNGKLIANIERINTVNYLGKAEESSINTAKNIEKVLTNLDNKISNNNATTEELIMGATLQGMTVNQLLSSSEKMSGEIYASAQALTFQQAQNINRDLSNRLSNLNNLKNTDLNNQFWISGIGSNGKLQRNGYASADTRVNGSQIGFDKKINDNTYLGLAFSYSNAKANFNKYAGNAKSDMIGVSLYGKKNLSNNYYLAGRLGLAHISTDVERDLINADGKIVEGKINHSDKMISSYLELGKKYKYFTPFIGISEDYLKRGKFNESSASWGIKADSKDYYNTNFLVGLRGEYVADKYSLQTYITHATNINDRNLNFEGHFSGSSVKQKFYGIKQAKNTIWLGIGGFRELSTTFGIYGNIDFRFEDKKKVDSIYSFGLKYKF